MLRRQHDSRAGRTVRGRTLRGTISVLLAAGLLLMSLLPAVAAAPSAIAPAAPQAGVLDIVAIYSNIPGHPTAAVPGLPGFEFEPGTGTLHFDRVFGSPNGNWVLTANNNSASTADDEMLLANNVVRVREGFAWPGGAELIGTIDTSIGVNDAGTFVFATNTDAVTTADDVVVSVTVGDVVTVIREGDAYPTITGAILGATLDTPSVVSDGTVAFRANLTGVPTTEDQMIALGSTVLGQQGVTVPTGTTETWEFFDVNDYFLTHDGSHWLAQGDLTGDTNFDDVVVVDGTIVVQEGLVLPGTTFPEPVDLNGIVGVFMAPNGDWFVRGNNDVTEADWVYSNSGLLATRGDPIYTGATELWDDTTFADLFFLHVGDSNGNYIIGGVTDAADVSANAVLVINNQAVIARENDPIDLDGNGVFDDDTYIHTFGNDDGYLSDDGLFYFVANIRNGAGTVTGQGFFSIDVTPITNPNTPPTLLNVAATSPINENESSTLTGEIIDPDAGDSFELEVNWGDGTVMTYTYPAGTTAFTETHQYLDDDPSGTPSDLYGLTLILTDSAGGVATAVSSVTVNNIAPTADAGPDQTAIISQTVSFSGSFTDPGTLDTHTIEWDFGDGNSASGSLTPTHVYADRGYYTVTLTVTDDDTGVGTDSLVVAVGQTPTSVGLSAFDGSGRSLGFLWLLALPAGLLLAALARRRQTAE
jgi:PKD repeat protein